MTCEHCHKAPATQVVSVSRDGKTATLSVCDACAKTLLPEAGGKPSVTELLFGFMKGSPPPSPSLPAPPPSTHPEEGMPEIGAETFEQLANLMKKILANLDNLPMEGTLAIPFDQLPPDVQKALTELAEKGMSLDDLPTHIRNSMKKVMGMLEELVEMEGGKDIQKLLEESGKPGSRCPACGLTRETLQKNRRFGCAECYATFPAEVEQFVNELQYGNVHCGRVPKFAHQRAKVAAVRRELSKAVAANDFLKAASLRDRIRAMEKSPVPKGAP